MTLAAAARSIAVATLLVVAVVAPLLRSDPYFGGLLVFTAIYALMALSLSVIMGQAGQWSFGHQAFLGIGAYAAVLLVDRLGVQPSVSVLGGALACVAGGLLLGVVALRRTRGMHLAIVTLAFGVVTYLIALQWYDVTGGRVGLLGLPFLSVDFPLIGHVEFSTDRSYYYLCLSLVCIASLGLYLLGLSRAGSALRATRENEALARAVGIPPFRHLVLAFAIGSGLAGFAGALLAYYLGVVNPGLMSFDYLFAMLIMVIIGGARTIVGPILGAIIYVWVPEILNVGESAKILAFGIVLAIVVAIIPQGLYPAFIGAIERIGRLISKHEGSSVAREHRG